MVRVLLDGNILAESDAPVILEGNYYFPPESVRKDCLSSSDTSSVCPWKGTAAYYSASIGDSVVKDIAWYYPNPSAKAASIKDHIAFYKNKVVIQD